MTEDRRGSFQKSLSHSTGQRNLSKSSNSKASKLLGVSTDEVLEASQKDLFRRRSSNDLVIPTGLQDYDDEEEQEHEHEQRTSTKSSVGSSSSKWSRNDSTSSATSTGSKIGGILKSSRVKFKSRRATVDEGSNNNNNNLASSLTRSEDSTAEGGGGTATTTTSTAAITRRGISWGSSKSDQENEDNIDNSDKVTPLDHRPNPFPLPQDKPRFKLMERSMSRRTRKSFRVGGGVGVGSYNPHNKAPALGVGGSTFYVSDPNDPRATKGDPFHNALRINNCNNMVKHIRVNDILSNMNSSSSKKDAGSDYNKDQDSLTSLIFKSLSNKGMCDVQLVGGLDDVIVNAPSYLLGVHSKVLESLFFYSPPKDATTTTTATANENKAAVVEGEEFFDTSCTSLDNDLDTDASAASERNNNANNTMRVVEIPFSTHTALKAMLHFLATRSLPDNLEHDANESNIRCICQIYLFGRLYKISSLQNHAYRIARLLMNKLPRLVCAAFDECIASTKRLPEKRRLSSSSVDELMDCCLEYLRETPLTTLLDGGTIFLNEDSIGAIICDQDMDVDEHTMFHILNTWVKQDLEGNIETGKALVSNINLAYIKTDYLNNVVRKCGFVDASDVQNALKEIEEMLANQSPDEKEHVLVEGAGNDVVNGIYVRMDEDIGMGEEEVLFIKEAPEDDYSCSDYGLYLLRSTWAITPCVDYSNILYSCDVRQSTSSTSHSRPPKSGWVSDSSADPPPTCTWNPSKDNNAKANGKGYVAPNLADVGRNNRQLSDVANGDHCEGSLVRRLTLRTMINLPTDEDFEDDDYA